MSETLNISYSDIKTLWRTKHIASSIKRIAGFYRERLALNGFEKVMTAVKSLKGAGYSDYVNILNENMKAQLNLVNPSSKNTIEYQPL